MKKSVFVLPFIFAISSLMAKPRLQIIHSVDDFVKLYEMKTFPFNKLSDTTFQRLKTTMVFDEQKNFRGFNYVSGLWAELTYEEYQKFNKYFTGAKITYNKEEKAAYEKRRNR